MHLSSVCLWPRILPEGSGRAWASQPNTASKKNQRNAYHVCLMIPKNRCQGTETVSQASSCLTTLPKAAGPWLCLTPAFWSHVDAVTRQNGIHPGAQAARESAVEFLHFSPLVKDRPIRKRKWMLLVYPTVSTADTLSPSFAGGGTGVQKESLPAPGHPRA